MLFESGALKKSASGNAREGARAVLAVLKKGGNMFPPFSQWLKDAQTGEGFKKNALPQ